MKGVYNYFRRDMLKWFRGKVTVISTLIMPAAWLIFVGLTLPVTFTGNYLDFITPGILVMTVFNASMMGGSLLIYDKILGTLNKFFALPVPRESVLFGKIFFILCRGLLQATIILVIAIIIGATILKPTQYLLTYFVLALFGILFAAIANTIGLLVGDTDSYGAVNAMISMPLFFASSALMPYNVMPNWLRPIAMLNPLSYAIDAIRALMGGTIMWLSIGLLGFMSVLVLGICVMVFRRASFD
jgi:ABC-2 type transport system permease protein